MPLNPKSPIQSRLAMSLPRRSSKLPPRQGGSLGSLCFARDGTTLFSGASDGSVAAWKLGLKEDGGGDAEQGANRGGGGSRSGSSSFGKSGALMKGGFLKAL